MIRILYVVTQPLSSQVRRKIELAPEGVQYVIHSLTDKTNGYNPPYVIMDEYYE